MIFQSYTLWPHMSVRENLSLAPSKVLNESTAEIDERAERALREGGMAHHFNSLCLDRQVPFVHKHWRGRTPKAGGRVLDGVVWDEMPRATRA